VSVDAALFMTCDQPMVTAEILEQIVAAFAAGRPSAVACEYRGTVGVPALFDRLLFGELRALDGDQGAKRVIERHLERVRRISFEPGSLDIDTPQDAGRLT
jgi:molybdenum cofactor cytidylyltransferase